LSGRSLDRPGSGVAAVMAYAEKALEGLGRAIDRQFDAWGLTPAEREVALLILKGHGHKQIAGLTGRSERTVRQRAVAVYDKAGLGAGRNWRRSSCRT
jgi:DNA-binding NarL/FixJ family response regulator